MTSLTQLITRRREHPEAYEAVTDAVESLEPSSRALLRLSFERGMSAREIADALQYEPGDVAVWTNEALRELADALTPERPARTADVAKLRTRLGELPSEAWDRLGFERAPVKRALDAPAHPAERTRRFARRAVSRRPSDESRAGASLPPLPPLPDGIARRGADASAEQQPAAELEAPLEEQPPAEDAVTADVALPATARRRRTFGDVVLIALSAGLVPLRHNWVAAAVLLALLLIVPGSLLLRALRVPSERVRAFPLYVPAASIVVLSATGLAVDLIGPHVGVAQPLRTLPLLVGVTAANLVLAAASAFARVGAGVPWRIPRIGIHHIWPLLLPLAAAVGARFLNDGRSPAVAVAVAAVSALAIFACVLRANRMSTGQLALMIFAIALACEWAFSLRSDFVYGWDISTEYHVLTTTIAGGVWHPVHPDDAYGAMLSLTILPSIFHGLANASPLFQLKVLDPALFALFPAAMFMLASRVLSRRFAFVAAAFIVIQAFFFQQMPAIARQEIALVLFIALVGAALEQGLRRRSQLPLVAVFAIGLVVAHYSTTYLAADMFAGALILQVLATVIRRSPRLTAAIAVACVVTAAGAYAWYGPVTHSNSNVTGLIGDITKNGFDFLPNATAGQNPVESYLSGNVPKNIPAQAYERGAAKQYAKTLPYISPLPAASSPRYALTDSSPPAAPSKLPIVSNASDFEQTVVNQLANLLAVIGAFWLVFSRRTSRAGRLIGMLGLSTLGVLAMTRLSGTIASDYNQEREFAQTMVPLAIAMAWVLESAARRWARVGIGIVVLSALALATVFIGTSSLRGAVLGGGTLTNLSNRGEDYERFYVTPPELAAANWTGGAVPKHNVLYTDRYGELRLFATTGGGDGMLTELTPMTLDRHAWVYATRTNIVDHRARARNGQSYTTYTWPARFLADYFNTVYSNGSSRIYHGP